LYAACFDMPDSSSISAVAQANAYENHLRCV
jgi:hypothetical protein